VWRHKRLNSSPAVRGSGRSPRCTNSALRAPRKRGLLDIPVLARVGGGGQTGTIGDSPTRSTFP
jgi:hypothetical protein